MLLLNAAYRDGETEQPYPHLIGLALRVLVPLTLVISVTATWSLFVRTHEYGLTVDRVWGWLVALTAVALTAGYSVCAFRKGRWMRGMDRVNVVVLIALIAALVLMLTPVLSPYRLTADSQDQLLRAGLPQGVTDRVKRQNGIIRELRFDAGEYGKQRLRVLAADRSLPDDVVRQATAALAKDYDRHGISRSTLRSILTALPMYPKGRTLPNDLAKVIEATELTRHGLYIGEDVDYAEVVGLFADLTGDHVEDLPFSSAATVVRSSSRWATPGVTRRFSSARMPVPKREVARRNGCRPIRR